MAKVLILGDDSTAEMRPVASAVAVCADVRRVRTLAAAEALVGRRQWHPELVVVCQHWSDEFPRSEIDRLFARLPLARWMCCFGAWCEADGRNRDLWPLAMRVPARWAAARLRCELAVVRGESPPLPWTASRDEAFAFDAGGLLCEKKGTGTVEGLSLADQFRGMTEPAPLFSQPQAAGTKSPAATVQIVGPDRELRRMLQACLRRACWRLVAGEQAVSPAVVVRDLDPWTIATADDVRAFHHRRPSSVLIGLMSFAHPADVESARACGVAAVVAKLAPLSELLRTLENAVPL